MLSSSRMRVRRQKCEDLGENRLAELSEGRRGARLVYISYSSSRQIVCVLGAQSCQGAAAISGGLAINSSVLHRGYEGANLRTLLTRCLQAMKVEVCELP
jgi:predicted alpha/beta hydrolase